MKKYAILLPLLLIFTASCTQQKQLVYLQGLDKTKDSEFFQTQRGDYHIQNQDILYIQILSMNQEINEVINNFSSRYSQSLFQNETSLYINGYVVNDSGYINIPVLGLVKVLDRTVNDASKLIQERADQFLKGATVIVKLISFKFTVLGEVSNPGVYRNYNNQLTVLEAIGMAGDITDFGDRRNILVVRPTNNGTETYRMNLLDKKILESKAFFLLPNDIVYVEPIKSKIFRINIPTISLFLTSVTTLILILNFIK
jgi:polysaccharide export outer membrane protein